MTTSIFISYCWQSNYTLMPRHSQQSSDNNYRTQLHKLLSVWYGVHKFPHVYKITITITNDFWNGKNWIRFGHFGMVNFGRNTTHSIREIMAHKMLISSTRWLQRCFEFFFICLSRALAIRVILLEFHVRFGVFSTALFFEVHCMTAAFAGLPALGCSEHSRFEVSRYKYRSR